MRAHKLLEAVSTADFDGTRQMETPELRISHKYLVVHPRPRGEQDRSSATARPTHTMCVECVLSQMPERASTSISVLVAITERARVAATEADTAACGVPILCESSE